MHSVNFYEWDDEDFNVNNKKDYDWDDSFDDAILLELANRIPAEIKGKL